jgi:hypothetical protein
MPSAKKKALKERVKFLEATQARLDKEAEDIAARLIQAVWRRFRRIKLLLEPRRRSETPDGCVHFFRGPPDRDRRYRIERPNGNVEYYVPSETHRTDGKRLYAEWPDGRVDVFEGPDDNRRCLYAMLPDGCRDHYEGDAGKEVRTRRDLADGVVQFFAMNGDREFVRELWWPRSGLRRIYDSPRSGHDGRAGIAAKQEPEWLPSCRAEKVADLKRAYRAAWAPYDRPNYSTWKVAQAFHELPPKRPPAERVHPPPESRPKTPSYAMDAKKKNYTGKKMLANLCPRVTKAQCRSTQKLACKFTGLGQEGLSKMKAYHLDDELDYDVHYEPPNGFLKLLMGAAMQKQDATAQSYCLLKDKQQKAKAFCEKWGDWSSDAESDHTLMLRESARRNLIMIDSALHALRARVRSEERPDDLGLRVLHERAAAATALHTKNAKELSRAMNACFANTESIDRKTLVRQLRKDHLAALMRVYKGRLLGMHPVDPGLRTVVAWMLLKHNRMVRGDPLPHDAAKGPGHWTRDEEAPADSMKLFEVSMIDQAGPVVLWADESDFDAQVFWTWSWRGQPKTLQDEISDSLAIMKRAIIDGLVTRWIIAPAKEIDEVTGKRTELLQSEVQLAHDQGWHGISSPMPAYWLDFFARNPKPKFDMKRDAWIGAEFLFTLVEGHHRCLLRDHHESICKAAWLDVLAYEDKEEEEEEAAAAEEAEEAPPADGATEDADQGHSLRLLPNAHIADMMQRIHSGEHNVPTKFSYFTLEKTTTKNGRRNTAKLERDHLNICPRPGWTLELELECMRGGMLGDHTVIASLPDTLLFLVKYKQWETDMRTMKFPTTLDFANYTEGLKKGVEPKEYELVGVQEWVKPTRSADPNVYFKVDLGYIRDTSRDETGQWYAVLDHDYHVFHKPGNAVDAPPLEVSSGISADGNNSTCALVAYRVKEHLLQERGVLHWMRKGCAWPEHMESYLAMTTYAQHELFHMATTSARWYEASQNLGSIAAYFSEIYHAGVEDTGTVDACELARRVKVICKIRHGLTHAEFSKALIDTNARIKLPVVTEEMLAEMKEMEEMEGMEADDRRAKRKAKAEREAEAAAERAAEDRLLNRLLREARAARRPCAATKPPPPPKPTKREEEREAARLARQLEEACAAEREQQVAAAKKAEAEKQAVEDAKREEARKRAEAERIRAEAIALEEAEDAAEAAKQAEEARVKQVRASRKAEHLEHREAQQTKRDPNATGLQRQIAEEAKAAADAEKETARVAKLAAQQREAQAVQDEAYANNHEAQMAAKAAASAAKKAAAKAKKEAEKAAKQAKEEAEAVIAEQRRREEQAWAAAQAAPAAAPAADPTSNAAPSDCIICMETKATHVIVPCGHFCLCARCARNQNQCPLCRAPAVHIIQGFF